MGKNRENPGYFLNFEKFMNEADTCRITSSPGFKPPAGTEIRTGSTNRSRSRMVASSSWASKRGAALENGLIISSAIAPICYCRGRGQADTSPAGEGLQQAKDYAEILGLKFAYSTNGTSIIEFDYLTGLERNWLHFLPQKNFGNGRSWPIVSEMKQRNACYSRLSPEREVATILSGNRNQPGRTGRFAGPAKNATHNGHGHW